MTLAIALEAVVDIPGCPPNWSNQRLHHMARHVAMEEWRQLTWYAAQSARNQAHWPLPVETDPPAPRWVRVDLHRHRLLDEDNAVASLKPLLDGLKGVLLFDDSPAWMRLYAVEQHPLGAREQERTVIRVSLAEPS